MTELGINFLIMLTVNLIPFNRRVSNEWDSSGFWGFAIFSNGCLVFDELCRFANWIYSATVCSVLSPYASLSLCLFYTQFKSDHGGSLKRLRSSALVCILFVLQHSESVLLFLYCFLCFCLLFLFLLQARFDNIGLQYIMSDSLTLNASSEHTNGSTKTKHTKRFQPIALAFGKTYENGLSFPLMVEPMTDGRVSEADDPQYDVARMLTDLEENREYLFDLLHTHGVIHFRNFAANRTTPEDFGRIVTKAFGLSAFPYTLGNAVRKNIVGNIVFTANEAPPDRWIPFHHELAQTPKYPTYLLFYCRHPADTQGETPVVYSPRVYERLAASFPNIIKAIEDKGVIYSRTMSKFDRPHSAIGRGWQATFNADSPKQVEQVLKQRGYSWRWETTQNDTSVSSYSSSAAPASDDGPKAGGTSDENRSANAVDDCDSDILTEISPVLPAVLETHGKKSFFNQIYAAWFGWRDELNQSTKSVMLSDGTPFPSEFMHALKHILDEEQVAIPWKKGDFVLIDNRIAMHARNPFTGKRSILASLAN